MSQRARSSDLFGKTRVSMAAAMLVGGAGLVGGGVHAQQADQRIEITGSSIKRIDAEGALPVQVVTRDEIARSGVVSVEQLLQALPSMSAQGGISTTTGAGTSIYGRSTASLRGLGDSRTLVLVNGRRVAAFAGGGGAAVNVNNLPLAAIERVEVLKDGASSIYGSDAVAGVINFILTKSTTGFDISATVAKPTDSGGGGSNRASIVAGFGDLSKDRFNVTIGASVEKEKELKAKDRDFAKSGNVFPFLVAGATGQGNIEGAIDPVTGVRAAGFGNSPGTGYGNPLAAQNQCGNINMFRNPTNTSRGFPFCAFDSNAFVSLLPDRDSTNLSINGTFRVTDALELFADALYGKTEVTQRIQPSPVRRSFLVTDGLFAQNNVVPALILSPTNPNYATAAAYLTSIGQGALVGQSLAITSRVFDFGLRTTRDTSEQTRLVLGGRGTLFGLEYEGAYSRNEAKTEGKVIGGYFSQYDYVRAVNATGSDWNPWSLNQSAAFNSRVAAAEYRGPTLEAKSSSDVLDGVIKGDAFALPGGAAQYAVGLQARLEKYVTTPSAALGTGDIAGLGGSVAPVDRDRKVAALYAELIMPIFKGFEIGAAGRTDKYSVVGNSTTYKLSTKYQPLREAALRGSYSTGFRAPTLSDLYTPQTLGTSEQFTDPLTQQANLQVNAFSGGNQKLKPEKSKQFSFGVVLQPVDTLSMTIDYFDVKIRDAINTPSAQEVVSGFRAGNPTYASSVRLGPGGDVDNIDTFIVNSGDVHATGFDIDARWRIPLGGDRVVLGLQGTYFSKYDEVSPGGATSYKVSTIVDANGDPVIGSNTGGVILRWKSVLSIGYVAPDWSVTLLQNHTSRYETGFRQIDGERNFIGAQDLYDLNFTYTGLVKGLRLAVGAKNILNEKPKGVFVPVSNQFQAGYDVTQYDARGRFVYVTAGYKF